MSKIFCQIRDMCLLIKRKVSEKTTQYEIIPEYDLKVRCDGTYYYENEKGDIIEPSS